MPKTKPAHTHHWRIETVAVDGEYPAYCLTCNAKRNFTAQPYWPTRTEMAQLYREEHQLHL